jgi:hypothetical protein
MREIAPEGFIIRHPHLGQGKGKIHREKVLCLGPHEKWSVDGHEKLSDIGFGIYGIRDTWGVIHGYWVVPSARLQVIPEYLYLKLVQKVGGTYKHHCIWLIVYLTLF